MSSANHEDGEYIINIRFNISLLNINDITGLSLIPDDLKINKTDVKAISIDQNYAICQIKEYLIKM